jgi:hypothetical protein
MDEFIHNVAERMGEDCAGLIEATIIDIRGTCRLNLADARKLIPIITSLVRQIVMKTMDLAMEVEEEERR